MANFAWYFMSSSGQKGTTYSASCSCKLEDLKGDITYVHSVTVTTQSGCTARVTSFSYSGETININLSITPSSSSGTIRIQATDVTVTDGGQSRAYSTIGTYSVTGWSWVNITAPSISGTAEWTGSRIDFSSKISYDSRCSHDEFTVGPGVDSYNIYFSLPSNTGTIHYRWGDESTGLKYVTATITKAGVAKPTLTLIYTFARQNGRPVRYYVMQSASHTDFYTVNGKTDADQAGRYSITLTTDSNHMWSDDGSTTWPVTWIIEKKIVSRPVIAGGSRDYEPGNTNGPSLYSDDLNYMYKSGTWNAENVGSYTASVTLYDTTNINWVGGGTEVITGTWYIWAYDINNITTWSARYSFTYDGSRKYQDAYYWTSTSYAPTYSLTGTTSAVNSNYNETYTMYVNGTGNYTGQVTLTWHISRAASDLYWNPPAAKRSLTIVSKPEEQVWDYPKASGSGTITYGVHGSLPSGMRHENNKIYIQAYPQYTTEQTFTLYAACNGDGNHYAYEGSIKIAFTVYQKLSNPVTWNPVTALGWRYSKSAQTMPTPIASASAATSISYEMISQSSSNVSYNASTHKIDIAAYTNTGTYTVQVRAKAAETTTYEEGHDDKTFTITISKTSSDMTWNPTLSYSSVYDIINRECSGTMETVTKSSTGATTYTGSSSTFVSFHSDTLKFWVRGGADVGSYTITVDAYDAGDSNYNPTTISKTFTITVTKGTATITMDTSPTRVEEEATYSRPASSNFGTVSWSSSSSSIATIAADGTVTAISPGTVSITASVAETNNYTGDSKSYSLTVFARRTRIPLPSFTNTFDDSSTHSWNYSGESRTVTFNIASYIPSAVQVTGTMTSTDSGNFRVTFSIINQDTHIWADESYVGKSLTWAINPIKIDDPIVSGLSWTYDGYSHQPSIIANPVLIISGTYSAQTWAGTYLFTIKLPNTEGHQNVSWNDGTFDDKSYSWTISDPGTVIRYCPESDGDTSESFHQTIHGDHDDTYTYYVYITSSVYEWENAGSVSLTAKRSGTKFSDQTVYLSSDKHTLVIKYNMYFSNWFYSRNVVTVNLQGATYKNSANQTVSFSCNLRYNYEEDDDYFIMISATAPTNTIKTYTGQVQGPTVDSQSSITKGGTVTATNASAIPYELTYSISDSRLWSDTRAPDKRYYYWRINKATPTLEYDESGASVKVGETITRTGTTTFGTVTYSSSNTEIATVNESGVATGVKKGQANIIATVAENANWFAAVKQYALTVRNAGLSGLRIGGTTDWDIYKAYVGGASDWEPLSIFVGGTSDWDQIS